jgi:hypothetical protein
VGDDRRTAGAILVTRRSGLAVTSVVAVVFVVFGYTLWLTATHVSERAAVELSLDVLFTLPFVLVGALLLWKRAAGIIGWLLVGCGAGIGLTSAVNAYADVALGLDPGHLPADPRLALLGNPLSVVALGSGLVLLPLLFPDGSALSRRWRMVVRVAIAAMAASVLTGPFAESDLRVNSAGEGVVLGANPFAAWPGAGLLRTVAFVAFVTLLALVPVAFASLVHRYSRGTLEERLQIRWVVAAAGSFVAVLACLLGSEFLFRVILPELLWDALLGSAIALTPVAIGVAVLRYRLYDVDRVISRTVSYGLLSAALVGVYAVSVVGLGTIVRAVPDGDGSDLVVAGSTLGVAALFGPLRRRVQTLVDRRFNRARIDAQGTLARFSHQVRSEVDLDALGQGVEHVAARTMQPRSVSLWLRVPESPP